MNVGLLTYDFYPPIGGQGVEVLGLYNAFRERGGPRPSVISSSRNELEDHVSLPVRPRAAGQFGLSARLVVSLERLVTQKRLDVLQVYGGPGGVMLARRPPVPLVYVANHTYAQQHRFLGKSSYRALMRMEATGYRMSDRIVAISTSTAESLVADYGVSPAAVSVIPVGTELEVFKPMRVEKIPGSVLYVGRLSRRKGVEFLLRAGALVMKEAPGTRIYLIGEGERRAALEREAARLGISHSVEFLGRVGASELAAWYNRAEVFVLPSLFEGFGIVCVEAMACGTPVIACRAPGVSDIVEDGKNGMLVGREEEELAAAILRLLRDRELAGRMGRNGRSDAESRFGWAAAAGRFIGLYRDMGLAS